MISISLIQTLIITALSSYIVGLHLTPDMIHMIVGVLFGAAAGIAVIALCPALFLSPSVALPQAVGA